MPVNLPGTPGVASTAQPTPPVSALIAHCASVQAMVSLNGTLLTGQALFRAKPQPLVGWQSSVQGLPSLGQLSVPVVVHLPVLQASPVLQALPSLQVVPSVAFAWAQPTLGSQVSVVQGFPSSQLGPAPPLHVPLAQASLSVHALPSLQVVPSATLA